MVHKRQLYTSKTNVKYVATNCIKIIDSLTSINSSMFQDSYHILEVKSGGINTFIVFMSIKHSWRNLKTHRRWCGGNGRVLLGSPVGGRVDAGSQMLPPWTHHCVLDEATRPPPVSECDGAAVNECVGLGPQRLPMSLADFSYGCAAEWDSSLPTLLSLSPLFTGVRLSLLLPFIAHKCRPSKSLSCLIPS